MLNLKNFRTLRPMKKLDIRSAGPYSVSAKVGSHAYQVELPATSRVHNVFHVALLRLFKPASHPGQISVPPGPTFIDDHGEPGFEVANVLNSRYNTRRQLEYLVEWLGYEGTDEQTSWEHKEPLQESQERLEDFHARYPDKPALD